MFHTYIGLLEEKLKNLFFSTKRKHKGLQAFVLLSLYKQTYMQKKTCFFFHSVQSFVCKQKRSEKSASHKGIYTSKKESAFPCVSHVVTVYTGYGKVKIECSLGSVGTLHTKKSRKNLVYKQNG